MRLLFHRGDSDWILRDYVYLWNALSKASEKAGAIQVVSDSRPFAEATDRWRLLVKKG